MKVLRLEAGDQFNMGQVNGDWGVATINAIDEQAIMFQFEKRGERQPLHPVTLIVAQVRPICMKRILREAVSLGVEHIVVTGADTAERSYASAKMWSSAEYRAYLLDGAMQAGQTSIPSCTLVPSVDALLRLPQSWKSRILLDNVLKGRPLSQAEGLTAPVAIAVGPERGWSERERSLLLEQGFLAHTMGPRVLRTETACSAAIAVLLGRMGCI